MTEHLDVDVAHAIADFQGNEVDCAVPVLVTMDSRQIVWQSSVAVPLVLDDWMERVMTQFRTLRAHMERPEAGDWQAVAAHTNWWMHDPGDHPDYPHGLHA